MRDCLTQFQRLRSCNYRELSSHPEKAPRPASRVIGSPSPLRLLTLATGLILVVAMLLSGSPVIGSSQSLAALGDVPDTSLHGSLSQLQAATPLAGMTAAECAGGENLLENAGFESGTEGWYVDESVEAVTTEVHEGDTAVRLGSLDEDAYMDQGVGTVEPGATYALSGWGKLSSSGETGEIGIQFYDSDGERLMNEEPAPLTFSGTEFEQQQLTFSLPDQATELYVFISKVAGADDFHVDSLSLTVCQAEAPAEMAEAATPTATSAPETLATPMAEEPSATPTEEAIVATPTEEADVVTPEATQEPEAATPAPEPEADRSGCDPAYPEERTCIPPGPPFDQGCAITMERNFVVLPPDPQGLDRDQDGIGCEPIHK